MFDTITSKDRPKAASQAANTNRIIGTILARVMCVVRIIIDMRTNKDNIIPSRHSREDIICDRYISSPIRETMNASRMLI